MARPNPFPLSIWPEPYRTLGAAMDSSKRSVCGRFLHWCRLAGFEAVDLDPGRVAPWLDSIGPKQPWKSTRSVSASAIFFMLAAAHPERDFAWLKALAAAEGRPRQEGATFAHRRPEVSLPVDQWPEAWQRRWHTVTDHILRPDRKKGRYDHLLGQVVPPSWSPEYARGLEAVLGQYLWVMKEANQPHDMTEVSLRLFVLAKKELGVNDKWLPWYVKKLKAGLGVVLPNGAPAFVGMTARRMREERTIQGAYQHDGYRAEHPAMLAAIGLLLMERARREPRGSGAGVDLFRDGALFFTLAYRAMRVGTVIRLKLDEHVGLEKEGRIAAPGAIMKAKKAWRIDLNADLVAILKEWVRDFRPFSKNAGSPFLFVSSQPSKSGGMAAQSISDIIRRHSFDYLGRCLSAHDFRYATGTLAMEEFPDNPWIGSAMLAHHGDRWLPTYVLGNEMESATRKFEYLAIRAMRHARQNVERSMLPRPSSEFSFSRAKP